MAKKDKKNWWERESLLGDKFSNTRKLHEEKQKKLFGGNIENDDEDYGAYSYRFDDKLSEEYDEKERQKNKNARALKIQNSSGPELSIALLEEFVEGLEEKKAPAPKKSHEYFNSTWDEYERTGVWRGYERYRPQTLSYKYVQQMANMIAAQHNINVQIGNEWSCNLTTKTLTYNPTSLIYGTKGALLATLLHEVGKLKHSSAMVEMKSPWIDKYQERAYEASLVFEDLRVDMKMLNAYPSAPEVYESQGDTMKAYVDSYVARGDLIRKILTDMAKKQYDHFMQNYERVYQDWSNKSKSTDRAMFSATAGAMWVQVSSQQVFGRPYANIEDVQVDCNMAIHALPHTPMLEDYIAEMYMLGYGVQTKEASVPVGEYVEKTQDYFLMTAPRKDAQQDIVNDMDTEVYPHIEDLMKNSDGFSKELEKAMPLIAEAFKKARDQYMDAQAQGGKAGEVGVRKGGETNARGKGDEDIPNEWMSGDYRALKESVDHDIKTLVNKLTYIRREEQVIRWQQNERRGKLDARKLYRARFGNNRVFKRKLPNIDTIRSFCFSVMLDTSGSMQGPRMVHSTRSLIMFSEVFQKMGIPFEIITFETRATTIKGFDAPYDNIMKKKIAGLANRSGGGTELEAALKETKIKKREESNKILIALTDGDVGDIDWFNQKYFNPMLKKDGIKSIGIGIETGNYMNGLCNGNTVNVKNAAEVPVLFAKILKDIIKR